MRSDLFAGEARRFFHKNSEVRRRCTQVRNRNDVAAVNLIDVEIWHIYRGAHSWTRDFNFATVTLNRTNACFEIGPMKDNLLATAQGSAGQCSGHNCSDPAEREYPIDEQP